MIEPTQPNPARYIQIVRDGYPDLQDAVDEFLRERPEEAAMLDLGPPGERENGDSRLGAEDLGGTIHGFMGEVLLPEFRRAVDAREASNVRQLLDIVEMMLPPAGDVEFGVLNASLLPGIVSFRDPDARAFVREAVGPKTSAYLDARVPGWYMPDPPGFLARLRSNVRQLFRRPPG